MQSTYKVGDTLPADSLTATADRNFKEGELVAVRDRHDDTWDVRTYVSGNTCRRFVRGNEQDTTMSWVQLARLPQTKPQTVEVATFESTVQALLDEGLIVSVVYKAATAIYSCNKDNFSNAIADINQVKLKKQALDKLTPEEIQALGL